MSEYGETLARYRDEAGLSQRELGAAIGLDYTQLNKIEHGHRPPLRAKYMKPLVRALRLKRGEAENLVDLARQSRKVLDFMDEDDEAEKEKGQGEQQASADGHGEDEGEKEDREHTITTTVHTVARAAKAIRGALFDTKREEFYDLIDSAHLTAEDDEKVFTALVEIAKPILALIKLQHEK